MYIFASLARHAKYAGLTRILCIFLAVQSLIAAPIGVMLLRDPPAVFYPRIHGGPLFESFDRTWAGYIEVGQNELGFVSGIIVTPGEFVHGSYGVLLIDEDIDWIDCIHDFMFVITPNYVFYVDGNSFLGLPARLLPAWVLTDMAIEELFNHLALYNAYFVGIVAPVFLLIFIVILITQSLMMLASVWLFGHWVKLSGNMDRQELFSVCTFSSIPAGLAGFAVGIVLPVIHIFIAQLIMIYVSYRAIKEYVNI